MKVQVEKEDLLLIEDRPWFFALTLVFFVLVLSWAAIANFAAQEYFQFALLVCFIAGIMAAMEVAIKRTVLVLDRAQGTFSIATRSFRGDYCITHPLRHLTEAMVQTMRNDDSTAHRVALRLVDGMDKGIHPVTHVYTSGDGAKIAARAINRWLALTLDSRQSHT